MPTRLVGILAGFGAGAMISAIAFDLVPEAQAHIAEWQTVLWMLLGVAIFLLGDWVVDKRFGTEGAGGAMGIVVGSVVDGVPESAIFGKHHEPLISPSWGFIGANQARRDPIDEEELRGRVATGCGREAAVQTEDELTAALRDG